MCGSLSIGNDFVGLPLLLELKLVVESLVDYDRPKQVSESMVGSLSHGIATNNDSETSR